MLRIIFTKYILLQSVFILLILGEIKAQKILRVERIAVGTSVENRQPVGEADVFADSVGTLFCFTEIRGMGDSTTVSHVWYQGENRRAEVKLNVRGYRWRTWSTKVIQRDWTGEWRVDVVSADGKILKSKWFRIVKTNESGANPDSASN